ncbi:666_t:CDS:10 [Diversispora eburnea]|uniref:666_t:CDS:1 n=1 Tax=Diversispora eburnea TaxID=1213867 RepID=A0A9N8VWU7_9GLOM|nr:666_t:CDS:10 [Diversispora eburnea]
MEQQDLYNLEVSLHAHLSDKTIDFRNLDGTSDLTVDKYKFYEGCVVVEFKDHRQNPQCDGKRQLLRKNDDSLREDILRLNKSTGSNWSHEQALQVEAKLLVLLQPKLDLDPNSVPEWIIPADPSDSSNPNIMPTHRKLKKKKRKLNSSELEQEETKRMKYEQMIEFKPEARLIKYFRNQNPTNSANLANPPNSANGVTSLQTNINKGKRRIDVDQSGRMALKKALGARIRSMKFESDCLSVEGEGETNDKYTVIVHAFNEQELKMTGEYSNFIRSVDGKGYYNKLDDTKSLFNMNNKFQYDSDKSSLTAIHELTEDYAKKQTEIVITKGKKPHEIIEFLTQNPPSKVIPSPFEFKSNGQTIKIETISDLIAAATIKESQINNVVKSETPVINQDQIAMPPPPPPRRRNSQNNRQISQVTLSSALTALTHNPHIPIKSDVQQQQQPSLPPVPTQNQIHHHIPQSQQSDQSQHHQPPQTQASHTQVPHTQVPIPHAQVPVPHTQASHTQVLHTQVPLTQVPLTQVPLTQVSHTQVPHTQVPGYIQQTLSHTEVSRESQSINNRSTPERQQQQQYSQHLIAHLHDNVNIPIPIPNQVANNNINLQRQISNHNNMNMPIQIVNRSNGRINIQRQLANLGHNSNVMTNPIQNPTNPVRNPNNPVSNVSNVPNVLSNVPNVPPNVPNVLSNVSNPSVIQNSPVIADSRVISNQVQNNDAIVNQVQYNGANNNLNNNNISVQLTNQVPPTNNANNVPIPINQILMNNIICIICVV